jgi:hypothetical protein
MAPERFPSVDKPNVDMDMDMARVGEHSFRTEMTEATEEFVHSDDSYSNHDEEEGEQDIDQQVEKEHAEEQQQRQQQQQIIGEERKEQALFSSVSVNENEKLSVTKSILRRHPEPIPIDTNRKAWKVLPKPDMERLARIASNPAGGFFDKSQRRRAAGVVFKDVRIREYSQTLGDNPCVSYGPPISLDWDYEEFESVGIDEYERSRGQRRSLRQMILSYYQRRNLLAWQYGISKEELKLAKRRANKCKSERALTNYFVPAMMVEAALESVRRKAKRLVGKNKPPTTI